MDKDTLALLACPRCFGPLAEAPGVCGPFCASCRVVYPIIDGIPVLLVEESLPLPAEPGSRE